MKKITIALLVAITALPAIAQNYENEDEIRTLLGANRQKTGGYGGFGIGYSIIDDKDGLVMSGKAALLLGQSLGLGVAGSGFINDFHYNPALDADVNLTGGYGGLYIEPILFPKSPVHLAFPIVAGVGGIAYTSSVYSGDPWDYKEAWVEDTETFLVFEPGIELELNLLRFFRLGMGMTYRYTSQIELMDTPSEVLRGFTTGITFKFGKF